jgi:hypothetical protein
VGCQEGNPKFVEKAEEKLNHFQSFRAAPVTAVAQKKKPFAGCVSRKRSWSSSFLLYPMRRAPYVRHRVDGVTGPFKAGNLLPFRVMSLYYRE